MTLQATPTFRTALQWLEGFYDALNEGDVVDFSDKNPPVFPGLSQVSPVDGARLSQMSFGDVASQTNMIMDATNEEILKPDATSEHESERVIPPEDVEDADNAESIVGDYGSDPGAVELSSKPSRPQPSTVCTESTQNSTERDKIYDSKDKARNAVAKTVEWSFAERPVINGMTKAQRKRAKAKEEAAKARELAAIYRKGKTPRFVTFDEVAALLDGPYSFYYSKAMVDALVIPNVEVNGTLSVKPYVVGQDVPSISKIPQLPAVKEAVEAIKSKDNRDLLAYWPDYGFATLDQLDAMATLIEARGRFILVMKTHKWIDETEWRIADVREPFDDMSHVTKVTTHQMYTKYSQNLT
ncbi:hypothetical protein DVH05_014912 [Phytophthora capsici]|nr:hypothetical protein DVH05_014912 [Phytophthora capsici]